MSQATPLRGLWLGDGDPVPARERLRGAMDALIRARRLQRLVDHGCGGVLVGLGLAAVVVLATRLVSSPYSPWQLAGAAVTIALAAALLVGWRRRPDDLEVAIHADLTLKLKQRLSTAWEFMTIHDDRELAERLAVQAVKARLPVSPGLVFPLRVNRWGRLVPLAAAALLLSAVIDLDWTRPLAPRDTDERVMSEGQRLGAFGRAMQARARRDALPRSARQAERLERLGARMESDALSRAQALEQLREMGRSLDEDSMQALADANGAATGRTHGERAGRWPEVPGLDPGAMFEPATKGAPRSGDAGALKGGQDDVMRPGNPRREPGEAASDREAGEGEGRTETPEELESRNRKEHEELRRAREQVRQARENLGDPPAGVDGGRGPAADMDAGQGEEGGGDSPEDTRRDGSRIAGSEPRFGPRGDPSVAGEQQHSPFRPESGPSGPVLKPQNQARAGEVFVFQGHVLPNEVRPSVENVEMSREFAPQVEEVLSRDHYPAHYKEFVRRYFLSLSRGGRDPQQQPAGTR